ncbi:MAG: nitroreductase family protein [Pseudomonadota bacterium]
MTEIFPPPPEQQAPLKTSTAPEGLAEFLATRRSAGKATLGEPGPDTDTLADMLRVAARVPDHRKLEPWRFITITDEARHAFGRKLAEIASNYEDLSAKDVESAGELPLRAPVVVGVVSSPDHAHKTPVWEQELSAGAAAYNLLLAARAAGFGAVWLTEWISYSDEVSALLDLAQGERLAGFIYIGTPTADAPERPRPDMAEKVTVWTG